MIPLKLHIKNFLSYGSEIQIIDFTPHHLICLSGKNGHGKSALLDAITWAIWGIARKTATSVKADQGLLRLGQQQMMVILDFSLGEHNYRIRREFSLTHGKAQAHLDFGMIDPLSQKLIPLTDKTIRDTQHIIEETINIDFETFTNSAFLKQGQSNEFSKKSAKERKDILATILGLNQYDTIKKKALEKVKEAQTHEKTISAFQEKIAVELQKKDSIQREVTAVEQALDDNAKQELELKKKNNIIQEQYKLLMERSQKRDHLLYQKDQWEKSASQEKKILCNLRSSWRATHAQKQSCIDVEKLYEEQDRLQIILKQHQQKLQKNLELKELILKYKEELQHHSAILQQSHTNALMEARIFQEQQQQMFNQYIRTEEDIQKQQKENAVAIASLEKKRDELIILTKNLPQLKISYAQADLFFEKRKSFYQKYSAHGTMLHQKIKNISQKQALVNEGQEASCPLCEQNLSASRRRFLQQQLNSEYRLTTHQYQRIVRVLNTLKPLLIENHAQLAQQKKEIEIVMYSTAQQEEIEKQIVTLNQQRDQLITKEKEINQTLTSLRNNLAKQEQKKNPDFSLVVQEDVICQKQQTIINSLEAEVLSNNYCKQSHEKDLQDLENIQQTIKKYQAIQQELLKQSDRKQHIITQCQNIRKINAHIKTTEQELLSYRDIAAIESNLTADKQSLEKLSSDIIKEKNYLLEQKGRLLNEQQTLNQLEVDYQKYSQERQELNLIIDDYSVIAHATSKDGVQALLIEEAIPEIEQEANILLSKLTNNQAQISIESLRDLKKGGSKETLDIKISDATGSRPYELFSGGEAFRIDFALRIAISKLLARRAGTALQTLIIDEGFGSQDDEGLAHIMDALHKIQDDFAKVIIVSHLDILKEQFPVHFVVQKSAHGSNVTVIEHG